MQQVETHDMFAKRLGMVQEVVSSKGSSSGGSCLVSCTDVTAVSDACTQRRVVSETRHVTTLVNMA